MGKKIYEKLLQNNLEARLIEIDDKDGLKFSKKEMSELTFGNADDKDILLEVGIKKAVAIIAATNDDTTNLSILATAKKLNPEITTIVRENELEDDLIFRNANIDHIFTPAKILVNKITNALINPLADKFLKLIIKKDNKWASKLVAKLIQEIDENPLVIEIDINEKHTPQIYNYLKQGEKLSLDFLATSLHNKEQSNNVVPLLLQREDDIILTPIVEHNIKIGDKILLACDEHAKDDIEYICQNIYEFYYALNGEEKKMFFKGRKVS